MKNNGFNTIVNWALIVGAIALMISGFKYYNQSKTVRSNRGLVTEVGRFTQANQLVGALVQETVEYSKKNPDIKPILDSIIVKQNQVNAPVTPAKPVTK